MITKKADWKKQIMKPNGILYTRGKFREGFGYPNWISIDKEKNLAPVNYKDLNKIFYQVGAKRKINMKGVGTSSHFKSFKLKSKALAFARAYMRKH